MKNKNVGFLITGISIIIIGIVLLFNLSLKNIVSDTCSHGTSCTMYSTIQAQTILSIAIAGIILLIGLFFIFTKEHIVIKENTIIKKVKEKIPKKKIDLTGLDSREKQVIEMLQENKAIFQADLKEKLNIGKVGLTRLLDKLESKQLIERKRRGMNNIIVLKE